jgi:hypothetical protein
MKVISKQSLRDSLGTIIFKACDILGHVQDEAYSFRVKAGSSYWYFDMKQGLMQPIDIDSEPGKEQKIFNTVYILDFQNQEEYILKSVFKCEWRKII